MAKKTRSLKKVMTGKDPSYPWKFSGIKWKRAEAIVLASTLCFFYLCSCYHIRAIND
ncbi:hypothetical protein IMY05_002G0049400 [Salix suchowensis]|nr:hypothetical protein IMY05_002G0049400 [Salix suchowensis]